MEIMTDRAASGLAAGEGAVAMIRTSFSATFSATRHAALQALAV
jgi:hypothetical protein